MKTLARLLYATLALSPLQLAAQSGASVANPSATEPKSVLTASALGMIPGAGHVYAGEEKRGLVIAGGLSGLFLVGAGAIASGCVSDIFENLGQSSDPCSKWSASEKIWIAALLGAWGWSIFDAGQAVRRTNAKRSVRAEVSLLRNRSPSGRSVPAITVAMAIPF